MEDNSTLRNEIELAKLRLEIEQLKREVSQPKNVSRPARVSRPVVEERFEVEISRRRPTTLSSLAYDVGFFLFC